MTIGASAIRRGVRWPKRPKGRARSWSTQRRSGRLGGRSFWSGWRGWFCARGWRARSVRTVRRRAAVVDRTSCRRRCGCGALFRPSLGEIGSHSVAEHAAQMLFGGTATQLFFRSTGTAAQQYVEPLTADARQVERGRRAAAAHLEISHCESAARVVEGVGVHLPIAGMDRYCKAVDQRVGQPRRSQGANTTRASIAGELRDGVGRGSQATGVPRSAAVAHADSGSRPALANLLMQRSSCCGQASAMCGLLLNHHDVAGVHPRFAINGDFRHQPVLTALRWVQGT